MNLFLFVLEISMISMASGSSTTNTNQCMMMFGSTAMCLASATTPTRECCTTLNNAATLRCMCNDLFRFAMNATLSPNYNTALTRAASCLTADSCSGFAKYSYGCTVPDTTLEFQRYITAKTFLKEILSFAVKKTCFDFAGFVARLRNVFTETVVGVASYGLGEYKGIEAVGEYFSLLSPEVNKGFLSLSPDPTGVNAVFLELTKITIGSSVINTFLGGYQRRPKDYLETSFEFASCSALANRVDVPPVSKLFPGQATGVATLTEMLYKVVASDSLTLGAYNICRYHNQFCTGTNSQFTSLDDCMEFMQTLPKVSARCGITGVAGGNSVTCRAKHQFMAQINPKDHCPHLGKTSTACSDTVCVYPGEVLGISTSLLLCDVNNMGLRPYVTRMDQEGIKSRTAWKFSSFC